MNGLPSFLLGDETIMVSSNKDGDWDLSREVTDGESDGQ